MKRGTAEKKPSQGNSRADSDANWRRAPKQQGTSPQSPESALTSCDYRSLDPQIQKLVLLLSSPPNEAAPKTVKQLWNSSFRETVTDVCGVLDKNCGLPESDAASCKIFTATSVSLLLELLPALPLKDDACTRSFLDLLARVLVVYKLSTSQSGTLLACCHLLDGYSAAPASLLPSIQHLLSSLCLQTVHFFDSHTSGRMVKHLISTLNWKLSSSSPLAVLHTAQALANLAYPNTDSTSSSDLPDCLTPTSQEALLSHTISVLSQFQAPAELDASVFLRTVQLCLHLLGFLLQRCPPVSGTQLHKILRILRVFMSFGVVDVLEDSEQQLGEYSQLPTVTFAASFGASLLGKTKKSGKKSRYVNKVDEEENLEKRLSSLELSKSEFADLLEARDFSQAQTPSESKDSLLEAKVRLVASTALSRLCEVTQKKILHSYWLSFFPDSSRGFSLLTLLLKERNFPIRLSILEIINSLFLGSRTFLAVAEDFGTPKTAFTPLSLRLAISLREVHRHLLLGLLAEQNSRVQLQLLRCLSTLINNVSYQKLKPGIITKMFKVLSQCLQSDIPDVKTMSLTCFGALLTSDSPKFKSFELSHCLSQLPPSSASGDSGRDSAKADRSPSGFQTPLLQTSLSFESSWLVTFCLKVAHPQGELWVDQGSSKYLDAIPVRVEALQTLRCLVSGFWNFVRPLFLQLRQTISLCMLSESHKTLKSHAIKLLEAVILALNAQLAEGVEDADKEARLREQILATWNEFLPLIVTCLQSPIHHSIRSSSAELVVLLDAGSSSRISSSLTDLVFSVLFNLCQDSTNHVRVAASKALGCVISLPRFFSNCNFVVTLLNKNMQLVQASEGLVVRTQAAWTLANAMETLVKVKEDADPADPEVVDALLEEFNAERLVELFHCSLNLFTDNPKVKENAVRFLGCIFRFLPNKVFLSSQLQTCLELGTTGLAQVMTSPENNSAGFSRVRWNTSQAIRNVFHSSRMPMGEPWTLCLHEALYEALVNDRYFKVKVHATSALLVLTRREQFGKSSDVFVTLFHVIATSLANIHSMDIPFSEQFNKSLVCYLLGLLSLRFMSLIKAADLDGLLALVSDEKLSTVRLEVVEVWTRLGSVLTCGQEELDKKHCLVSGELHLLSTSALDAALSLAESNLTYLATLELSDAAQLLLETLLELLKEVREKRSYLEAVDPAAYNEDDLQVQASFYAAAFSQTYD